jgi:hypothetical protein
LAGCAARSEPAPALSRDARSANYCLQLAGGGTAEYDEALLLDCRREEYTAAARMRGLQLPPNVDGGCDAAASMGDAIRFFSWSRYALCVGRLAPPPTVP